MAKVLCVLYDDPVDGYPATYARDEIPQITSYPGGQTTPSPQAIDFTPGELLGSVSGEHSRGFHRLVKWRTGCEGRISYLKRCYGWDRTRLDGRQGAAIWCGHGVFAHNLVKIGALAS